MCKYCKKECEGNICLDCKLEQDAILWDNPKCEDLNMLYGAWGLGNFISIVGFIIFVISLFSGHSENVWTWIATIVTCGLIYFFSGMRRIYYHQLEMAIDREMRKRHS